MDLEADQTVKVKYSKTKNKKKKQDNYSVLFVSKPPKQYIKILITWETVVQSLYVLVMFIMSSTPNLYIPVSIFKRKNTKHSLIGNY